MGWRNGPPLREQQSTTQHPTGGQQVVTEKLFQGDNTKAIVFNFLLLGAEKSTNDSGHTIQLGSLRLDVRKNLTGTDYSRGCLLLSFLRLG